MTKRVYFVVHGGRVQGVGFRYFTKKKADEYGLDGWVRNTDDDKVEGEVQGDDRMVDTFLEKVDKGPRGSKVVKLDLEPRPVVEQRPQHGGVEAGGLLEEEEKGEEEERQKPIFEVRR